MPASKTRKPRRTARSIWLPRLVGLSRVAPTPALLALRPLMAGALAAVPGWRGRVEAGMRAALGPEGYSRGHVRAYFRHLADLLAFAPAVYRSGIQGAGLERVWTHDPAAQEIYRAALATGKGALMVGPHLTGHEIMVGTTTREAPVTVLVRQSPDPEYDAIKQRWYAALGVEVVHRPRRDAEFGPLAEMTAALRALRKNRVLALTPDLPQKRGTGIPVRLFNRQVELPAGAFFLAVRTGAPLLPSFFHHEDGRYRLWCHEPLPVDPATNRDAAIADLAQRWTSLFEDFVRQHPDMWQFWLDKRWARWLAEG